MNEGAQVLGANKTGPRNIISSRHSAKDSQPGAGPLSRRYFIWPLGIAMGVATTSRRSGTAVLEPKQRRAPAVNPVRAHAVSSSPMSTC